MNPEMVLWSRVLLQAIWDLAGIKLKVQKSEAPRLQRKTRAWFLSKKDSVGSFIWICNILSLEPDAVRERVLARPTAELRSLISSDPSEWNATSVVKIVAEPSDDSNSPIEEQPTQPDAAVLADEAGFAAKFSNGCEESRFFQRVYPAAGAPMHPAHVPAPDQTAQSLAG